MRLLLWIVSMNRSVCVLFTLVLAMLTMFAVASLPGLQLSDDHQLMLKSSAKEYSEYQQFKKSFPHEQQDLIVVLEGELWNSAGIGRLQSAVQALQALDTVQRVATVLDVPWVDQTVRAFKAGDQQAMPAIKTKLSNSAYLPSRFVADDFNVNTFTIALTTPVVGSRRLLLLANKDIREALDSAFENELQWKIAGYPVSQQSYKSYRMPKDWLVVLALDGLTACKLSYRLLLPFCRNQDHPTLLTMFDPLPLSFSGRSKILGRECERPRHLR